MNRDVIIACDFSSRQDTLHFLDLFPEGRKPFVKIGMELFYAEGPAIVRDIKARGHRIFLDLKLHDIPNTVRKAMRVLSSLDVDMVNVHASGTVAMMQAALEGLTRADGTRPLLIAVTQLTSTSETAMQQELLIGAGINDTIVKYASNARTAGLDGVVCSPLEAGMVKQACGLPHRHPGHPFRRRGRGRPGAHHHPRPGPRDRIGLHRRRPPRHRRPRPRGRLPALPRRICRLIAIKPQRVINYKTMNYLGMAQGLSRTFSRTGSRSDRPGKSLCHSPKTISKNLIILIS